MRASGNYNSTSDEICIVKELFDGYNVGYIKIEKNADADAGDILVTLNNGKQVLIEVKEEAYKRFTTYGDLGIDYISVFSFKRAADEYLWKGSPKPASRHEEFLEAIDVKKYGKLIYSTSDLWLFFVKSPSGDIYYHSFLDGCKVVSKEFGSYLKNNCKFAVNNKPVTQDSHSDRHQSAVYFINHADGEVVKRQVNLVQYLSEL